MLFNGWKYSIFYLVSELKISFFSHYAERDRQTDCLTVYTYFGIFAKVYEIYF